MINMTKAGLVAASAAVVLAMPISALAGFTPANRPTYSCITPTNCPGADHVVFNSFTNAPNYGDERAFFDAKDAANTASGGFSDVMNVKDGQEVYLRVYFHNNANPNALMNGAAIARNTRVMVQLPKLEKTQHTPIAAIVADNASPLRVDDTVTLKSDRAFKLSYVPGSAKMEYRPDGKNWQVTQLSDSIVNGGASMGDIKGCFEYSGFVTMKVKVSMPGAPVTVTEQPKVTPTALPQTGPEAGLAAAAGTGAMGYAVMAYRRSKRALAEKLINRK